MTYMYLSHDQRPLSRGVQNGFIVRPIPDDKEGKKELRGSCFYDLCLREVFFLCFFLNFSLSCYLFTLPLTLLPSASHDLADQRKNGENF